MSAENKSDNHSIHISGNVERSAIVAGDGNTVTYTTNVFGSFDANHFPARPSQQLSQQEYRWRQVLVQNVKHYWIEGVLERSLHNQALIELGLEERARAVASPISGAEEFANESDQPFPEGTQATDIFNNLGPGRTLLILGEPGAGKTTTLLKVVKMLITRIGKDFSQPIPVVLNLSSWAKKRQPIEKWLVQDLYTVFQVSKVLGSTWIKEEKLTLCLDGLDEVAAEHRNACVQALNHFVQSHGRTEIIVCSRIRDYEALSEQLRLKCAICVQPLAPNQIEQYLEQAGEQLSTLKSILSQNPEIKDFATSPLILSIMSLAYQGSALDKFPDLTSTEDFRQKLFDCYIERMFRRRGITHNYTDKQAQNWLCWIAKRMVQASQTVFFIESMQPTWLKTRSQKIWYQLESAMIVGLGTGLTVGLAVGLIDAPIIGAIYGLSSGLSAALTDMTITGIEPVETLQWSWKEAMKSLLAGLKGGTIVGLLSGLFSRLFLGPRLGLIVGLICGLTYVLNVGLIGGLRGPGMGNKTKPNQGVWKSAQNAGMFTLIFGLIGGLTGWLFDEWVDSLIGGLMGGLLGGLTCGLMGGGSACLRHISLRLILYCIGYVPWNYARFLDYATERLFLQRVGGGYIFIHRMLLEHFAQMELEQKPSK